ncbi:unnamed protein product, partial [Prorocentrum cordatum]
AMQKYKHLNRNMKKIEREEWAPKLYTEAKAKREKAKIETDTQREWGTMMNLDS